MYPTWAELIAPPKSLEKSWYKIYGVESFFQLPLRVFQSQLICYSLQHLITATF